MTADEKATGTAFSIAFDLTPTRMPTPNLPMATPFATPRPQGGIFEDQEIGLRVEYPFYWNRSDAAIPGALTQLANKPNDVFVVILRTAIPADQALEEAATDLHTQIGAWLGGLELVSDDAATTASGMAAWRSRYAYDYPYYGVVQADILSLAAGDMLITLAAFGQEQRLNGEREAIEQIFSSGVTLGEPRIYGVPRREAFIYTEQEAIEPGAYDPAIGVGDRRVFSGLVSLDPQLQLRPELAASWQISPDGRVYTFFLRRDATFHDGRPVTSADLIYAWERAADPRTRSETVLTYLGDIVGVAERRSGAAERISGLSAPDPYTIQVTIDAPKPYFLLKLTAGPAMVVDRANVEMGGAWYRTPNGTGPYRLTRWEPGKVKIYERSERFYAEQPAIRYLIARLDLDYSGLYHYMLDEIDMHTLAGYEVRYLSGADAELRAALREAAPLCTSFVSFDTSRPPFDDPQVRRAFALAVDHQRYQERTRQGANLPAGGLFPPGLPGAAAAPPEPSYDPEAARLALAESRYGGGPLPPITLASSGYGMWVEPGIGVLVQMWQEQLGATITIERIEPVGYADSAQGRERGNLLFWEWCADYPDPENFADALFHSGSPQNIGRYASPDLDALLERARVEASLEQRMDLYRQAEQLIIADAPAIFLDHRVDSLLVSPRIGGPVRAPGTVPIERYLTIVEPTP